MTQTSLSSRVAITRLVLVPSLITLGITLLRLVGELQHWSPIFFGAAAGGGSAIIGISWLPFLFGPYFALKLWDAGEGPTSAGRAIGMAILGFLVMAAGGFLAFAPQLAFPGKILVGLAIIVVGAALQFAPWPALSKTLLLYGFAARIPVAIVMFFALQGNWGTHYDALPPKYADKSFWPKYFEIGLVPQLVFWVALTIIIGTLCGGIAAAVARRRKPAPEGA